MKIFSSKAIWNPFDSCERNKRQEHLCLFGHFSLLCHAFCRLGLANLAPLHPLITRMCHTILRDNFLFAWIVNKDLLIFSVFHESKFSFLGKWFSIFFVICEICTWFCVIFKPTTFARKDSHLFGDYSVIKDPFSLTVMLCALFVVKRGHWPE